ncbi:MAG: ATP-grasp domain-containing protein, partial [Chloroflexota bacterium]|nr:ATP-grasp domain-containing protein [Chloroflexota bacterium]
AAIAAMGDKAAARRAAAAHGVPMVPGYDGHDQADDRLAHEAERVGWPLLVKPAAGGGGKGMHVVRDPARLGPTVAAARREARAAFRDDRLILERYLEAPRHVEVQLLFDRYGGGIHVGTRDCSTQRRHQKIVEEAPPAAVDSAVLERMGAAAVSLAAAIDYRNAGTTEFLVTDDGSFHFLEMNTRLQVEHPVTEMVTGRDLVADQIHLAGGDRLGVAQRDVRLRGHAIEARIYAEDPESGFLPATGRIAALRWPAGDGIRVDAGVDTGDAVTDRYDPLLAKLIVHASTRPAAVARLAAALQATRVLGVRTNVRFLRWLIAQPILVDGEMRTDTLEQTELPGPVAAPDEAWEEAARLFVSSDVSDRSVWSGGWRMNAPPIVRLASGTEQRSVTVEAHGRQPTGAVADGIAYVDVDGQSVEFTVALPPSVEESARHAEQAASGATALTAPMPGRVIAVRRAAGDAVAAQEPVVVVEAMKMENAVVAPFGGTVTAVHVTEGQQVQRGDLVAEVSA